MVPAGLDDEPNDTGGFLLADGTELDVALKENEGAGIEVFGAAGVGVDPNAKEGVDEAGIEGFTGAGAGGAAVLEEDPNVKDG